MLVTCVGPLHAPWSHMRGCLWVTWSVVVKITLQILLWVIQAWQDCHNGPRGMQRGMIPGISYMLHIICLSPGQSF